MNREKKLRKSFVRNFNGISQISQYVGLFSLFTTDFTESPMILNKFVLLFSLPSPKTQKIFLSHLFKIISQTFLTLPGHAHEFTWLDCSVILEHDQSQLSRDLNGMISEQLRPVISRVLDVILCWRR